MHCSERERDIGDAAVVNCVGRAFHSGKQRFAIIIKESTWKKYIYREGVNTMCFITLNVKLPVCLSFTLCIPIIGYI